MPSAFPPLNTIDPPMALRSIEGHLNRVFGGVRDPSDSLSAVAELNAVFSADGSPTDFEERLRLEIASSFPARWWWLVRGPRSIAASQSLAGCGYLLDHRRRGVAADVRLAAQATRPPQGTLFQEVRSPRDAAQVADLWSRSSPRLGARSAARLSELIGGRWGVRSGDLRFTVAWTDGRPTGAIGVCTQGATAGVFGLTVLPESRGRGIGRALLANGVRRAQLDGARWVVSVVRLDEEPFFTNFGFATYDEFEVYRASPLTLSPGSAAV